MSSEEKCEVVLAAAARQLISNPVAWATNITLHTQRGAWALFLLKRFSPEAKPFEGYDSPLNYVVAGKHVECGPKMRMVADEAHTPCCGDLPGCTHVKLSTVCPAPLHWEQVIHAAGITLCFDV